ncbi:hypothetical protein [Streptomyces sp. NBC_01190]|uniref:hypothetical protein n=1 Tax=Streptomyces sp. NBC_01190 TaxID=2903767 RepID=UPI0038665C60|nr:hypothetical protein OG519_27280 [Streptomyces sp. NBC_01190]
MPKDAARKTEPPAEFREMGMAHATFRREFGLLPALVRGVPPGDDERREIVARHIELVVLTLVKHVHGSDASLRPRLLDRVPDEKKDDLRATAAHDTYMRALTADLLAAVGEWRLRSAAGERVAVAADRLDAGVGAYATAQEESLLPLVEEYITVAEWAEIVQQEVAGTPPDDVALLFGMMMYEAGPGVIDGMIRDMPPDVQSVLKQVAAKAFATHARLVHGTATPPRGRA